MIRAARESVKRVGYTRGGHGDHRHLLAPLEEPHRDPVHLRAQPGRPGHHPLVLEPAPRGSADVAARADDRGRARDARGRGGQHVRLPPRRGRSRADRLPHRHGAGGRPARRRPRACWPGSSACRPSRRPGSTRAGRWRWWPGATRKAATAASSARAPSPASSTRPRSRSSRRWTGSGSWTRWPGPGTTPAGWRRRAAIRGRSTPTSSCTSSRGRTSRPRACPSGWSRASWASGATASPSSASRTTRAPRRWPGARTPSWPRASTR